VTSGCFVNHPKQDIIHKGMAFLMLPSRRCLDVNWRGRLTMTNLLDSTWMGATMANLLLRPRSSSNTSEATASKKFLCVQGFMSTLNRGSLS